MSHMDTQAELVKLRVVGFSEESDQELTALWEQFSNIQQATWLYASDESITRFRRWRETGDDEEAWT